MSNLQTIRRKRKLTQLDLASKSGVSLSAIQKYERGSKDINKAAGETLRKLSVILECNMIDLLECADEEIVEEG